VFDEDNDDRPVSRGRGRLSHLGYGDGSPPPDGPPLPPGPALYPPPPVPHYGSYSAQAVLRACALVQRGRSPGAALRAEGVRLTLDVLMRKAQDSDSSPFFAWALECLEIADAHAVGEMEERLFDRAKDGDVKALTFAVSRRSPIYRPPDEVPPDRPSDVVTLAALADLLRDPAALAALAAAGYRPPALPGPAELLPPEAPPASPSADPGTPPIRRRPPVSLDD
jgi:hypothetical protein